MPKPTENGVIHATHPESEPELRAQDGLFRPLPPLSQIPARIIHRYDQMKQAERDAVRLAHEIGLNLVYIKSVWKGMFTSPTRGRGSNVEPSLTRRASKTPSPTACAHFFAAMS